MGTMLLMMSSPVMRRPSREMTAEMAHPDGIRTCPSSFIVSHPFFMCFRIVLAVLRRDPP